MAATAAYGLACPLPCLIRTTPRSEIVGDRETTPRAPHGHVTSIRSADCSAQPENQPAWSRRKIAAARRDNLSLPLPPCPDPHASAHRRPIGLVDDFQIQELIAFGHVAQQGCRGVQCIDNDVGPPVAVQIADSQPTPRIGRSNHGPASSSDIPKPRTRVAKQSRTHRKWNAQPAAVENMPIRLDQIVPAVAVEIDQSQAETEDMPSGGGQPQPIGGVAISGSRDRRAA